MHDDIAYLELSQLAELLRTGRVTSVEVTTKMLERIDAVDPVLKSYALVLKDQALAEAAAADAEIARGGYRGPLHGVPVAVKDLAYTQGIPTAAGTTIHADFRPDFDATVVSRLREAGAVLLGKLRMTEGAYTSHHPDLPTPLNPWGHDTWTGSSSSGSGVAAAAGLAFATLGSDTGGSIRLPSAQNGVTGLKPTWGRVSRHGVFTLAGSLDHIGPMCRSAKDAAIVLSAIAGRDEADPTSAVEPVPVYEDSLRLESAPVVGLDPALLDLMDEETRTNILSAAEALREMGWTVLEVSTKGFVETAADWIGLCAVETAEYHAPTYPSRKDEYGPDLAGLIEKGLSLTATEYQTMMERRRSFTGDMKRLFQDIDILLLPGTGLASPTVEQMATLGEDPALFTALTIATAPIDNCGFPSITMPTGSTGRGTPLSVQFVGAPFSEQMLFAAGHTYQSHTDFHCTHPTV
ncbi:amidase [Brevibacterium litoralis]|uniref:amidase n=1 Tax=Brevibacterium litoralis TaxID=3138935 RepID=UPI0032EDF20E